MLLLLEIYLTVTAWNKGWKSWALAPLGATMAIGFLLGVALAASGHPVDPAELMGPGLALDGLCIVVLGVMSAVAPKRAAVEQPSETQPAEEREQALPPVSNA